MKKKFLAIYALTGALVASPVFTSCVDDSVSPSVEAQREANVKYKNALTAQTEANTAISQANAANNQAMAALNQEAQRLQNESTAAYNAYIAAIREYELAEKEYQASLREYNQALQEKKDAIELERLQAALEQTKANAEQTKAYAEQQKLANEAKQLENEKAKATLELDILAAELKAEKGNAQAQAELLEAQAKLEKVIKGLELKEQAVAETLRKNAIAIMNGGTAYFEALPSWGGAQMSQTYESTYIKDNINSIMALNNGLVAEKMNLLELENDLVDINTWIAEQVKTYEDNIATQEALIAKYKELQTAGSNLEDLQKVYDEAELNVTALNEQIAELGGDLYNAKKAYADHNLAMNEDPIQKLKAEGYMTEMEKEEYKDTIASDDGITSVPAEIKYFDAVLEHTAEDAEELATAITDKADEITNKEAEIAGYEAALEKLNGDYVQRMLTLAKVDAEKVQKQYDDAIASEAYKKAVADLEKAVADAQAAFDENPTSFKEPVYDENGNHKYNQEKGEFEYTYGTKELLEQAEKALAKINDPEDADNEYIVVEDDEATPENEEITLGSLVEELNYSYQQVEISYNENSSYVNHIYTGLNGVVEFWQNKVDTYISGIENNLAEAKTKLETLNADLETLKGYQVAVAEGSEEMTAYLALCETRKELQKAVFDLDIKKEELKNNKKYWEDLNTNLSVYVENGINELPDWADLIAEAEKTIATNKNNIAEIAGTNMNSASGNNQIDKEALIVAKKAELEAMEAELEVRQAEYDAVMAELEALLEAETEVVE